MSMEYLDKDKKAEDWLQALDDLLALIYADLLGNYMKLITNNKIKRGQKVKTMLNCISKYFVYLHDEIEDKNKELDDLLSDSFDAIRKNTDYGGRMINTDEFKDKYEKILSKKDISSEEIFAATIGINLVIMCDNFAFRTFNFNKL